MTEAELYTEKENARYALQESLATYVDKCQALDMHWRDIELEVEDMLIDRHLGVDTARIIL